MTEVPGDAERNPKVSIIVPAFNAAATLGATISGALSQTYENVEVVVVDDGSHDETLALARSFGSRLTVVSQQNRGLSPTRNLALEAATGDFAFFCDADDMLLPNAVASSLAVYRNSGARTVITNEAFLLTSEGLAHGRRLLRGTVPPPDRQRSTILERKFVGILSLVPMCLFSEVGNFDPRLRMLEDWHLWLRAIYAGWTIAVQPTPAALYRLTAGSLSTSANIFDVEQQIISEFGTRMIAHMSEAERRYLERRSRLGSPMQVRQQAATALRNGQLEEARQLYHQLAQLSVNNPRVRARAIMISSVPGAAAVFSARQRAHDRRLGSRLSGGQANCGG